MGSRTAQSTEEEKEESQEMMEFDGHRVKKRSILINGHRTSVSLEDAFWDVLKKAALERNVSLNQLVTEIDHARTDSLSSAVRVFVLKYAQSR